MTEKEIYDYVKAQIALESCCEIYDYDSDKNTVTEYAQKEGQRHFGRVFPISITTFGKASVVTAEKEYIPIISDFVEKSDGHELMNINNLTALQALVPELNLRLILHMNLPKFNKIDTSTDYEIRWYEQKDIGQFYGQWFSHALMPQFHPQHPDVLAVCAFDKGEVVGMAACQADTDMMWQIGLDVKKEYRGKRIGTVLSALLKEEILRRGKIPYYGTLEANIYSQRIAYEIGFCPSWIECRMLKKVK